jgi:hypothetical protein
MTYILCPLAYQIYLEAVPFFMLATFQQIQIYTIITTCRLALMTEHLQGEAKGKGFTFILIATTTSNFIGSVSMEAQKVTNLRA